MPPFPCFIGYLYVHFFHFPIDTHVSHILTIDSIPLRFHTETQVSVAGSKAILAKIDVLPQFTTAVPPLPALPANVIFRFTGTDAETNRDTFVKSLPKFPFPPDSPPLSIGASLPQKDASVSTTSNTTVSPSKSSSDQGKTVSPSKPPSSSSTTPSLEASVLSSTQHSKQLREKRIDLLRKDEKLRTAYHDLVISPPHIFSDEDFWNNYSWENPGEIPSVEGAERDGENFSSISAATDTSSGVNNQSSGASKPLETYDTGITSIMDARQEKSIENEMVAGSGFFDLMAKSFVDDRLKLALTPALRKQIYEEFPMVRVAFNSRVPAQMTAGEFWNLFFKSQLAKMMRKKNEEAELAKAKRTKAKKTAKKTETVTPALSSPPKAQKMTEEELKMQFFEKLTDATPSQLNSLVWQSRASDAVLHDPKATSSNAVSQRGSLISMLAEDDAVSARANNAETLSLISSLQTTSLGSNSSKSRFITDQAIEEAKIDSTSDLSKTQDRSKNSNRADIISQQQAALKHRISLISRGVGGAHNIPNMTDVDMSDTQKDSEKSSTSRGTHSESSNARFSGAITAEEMLFSALQEQSNLDATTSRSQKSAGTQSVLNAWYGGTSDVSQSSSNGKPSDAIEVLEGLVVEAGELDDESWSELKKEKEKRNRHLQLIRKFNRHGHIITSSTAHAYEADDSGEKHKTSDFSSTSKREELKRKENLKESHLAKKPSGDDSKGVASSTQFGDEVSMQVEGEGDDAAHSHNDVSNLDETKKTLVKVKREFDSEMDTKPTPFKIFRYPRIPVYAPPDAPIPPSSESISNVISEMQSWTSTSSRPKRPVSRKIFGGQTLASAASGMDVDLVDVESMISKVVQWRRHFWNLMERASAAQSLNFSSFSFSGAEKLAPITSQLESFGRSLGEMKTFLENLDAAIVAAPKLAQMLGIIEKEQAAIARCLTLYSQLH